jgi:hypothetical protein
MSARKKKDGMGSHQSAAAVTTTWITPPHIGPALGMFDLDPCEHTKMPWRLARDGFTIHENGLRQPWEGSVWLNPPYTTHGLGQWMDKMRSHEHGIALLSARTEIDTWHTYIWPFCFTIFWFKGRLWFYDENGQIGRTNAGAPSVLISYDAESADRIADSGLPGRHLPVNSQPIIIVGISPSWKSVIKIALNRTNRPASVKEVYDLVEQLAPDKCQNNAHWKEKVWQQLQEHSERISKGLYSNKTVKRAGQLSIFNT